MAWVDARNGVAGDMLLGALLDAGASLEHVREAVDAVIPATVDLRLSTVRRAGMRASKLAVDVVAEDLPHRDWTTIRSMLELAPLNPRIRANALAVFSVMAEAEARSHGIEAEKVHFHEVGAWDSIADVVGVCAALEALGVDHLYAGTVALGSGSVRSAHGQIPVPVPAVLELSRGWDVVAGGEGELATPTGMALLAALAAPSPHLPPCTIRAVGVGAGTRDDAARPNVVRVVVGVADPFGHPEPSGTLEAAGGRSTETRVAGVLEANVDDLDPRVWPVVLDALLAAGADDAWLTPILMKKGRPAHTLSVLASTDRLDSLRDEVFTLVPTLGVREYQVTKFELQRAWHPVTVGEATVRIKIGHSDGRILTATPEFADVAAVAEASGRPLRVVFADAVAAAEMADLAAGKPVPPPD